MLEVWVKTDHPLQNMNFLFSLKMILQLIIFTFLSTRECTQNYGKVSIENKSNSTIRVTLSPANNWNDNEQQMNHTLFRNPDKITGGNIIM